MLSTIVAISGGAALGALARWTLGLWLNALFPAVPPGTLVANLVGGYLIGLAMPLFLAYPEVAPAWRLFLVTGFLGGLTTFSAFSGEVALLLQQGRIWMAAAAVSAHVVGSLLMTLLGFASAEALKRLGPS